VSYEQLLTAFFRSVDPTDDGGQFCDRGHSYTTAVYAVDDAQLAEAKKAKTEAQTALGTTVVTEVVAAPTFWPAEDYHQDYYTKNPLRYKYYRNACGRDDRIREVWGAAAMQGIKGS
jgi:peptide-methionine (S)-S-oxide reductase